MGLDPQTAPRPDGLADLIRRIEDIERKQKSDIASVAQSFAGTVADLQAAQAALASQLASINALIGAQTRPASDANSQTATLTTTESSYAVVTFTVPTGFTQAQVIGLTSLYCSSGTYVYLQTRIAGVNGQVQYALGVSPGTGNAASGHARTLTGLTAGSTFTVEVRANTATSTVTAVMLTAAQVLFLR